MCHHARATSHVRAPCWQYHVFYGCLLFSPASGSSMHAVQRTVSVIILSRPLPRLPSPNWRRPLWQQPAVLRIGDCHVTWPRTSVGQEDSSACVLTDPDAKSIWRVAVVCCLLSNSGLRHAGASTSSLVHRTYRSSLCRWLSADRVCIVYWRPANSSL